MHVRLLRCSACDRSVHSRRKCRKALPERYCCLVKSADNDLALQGPAMVRKHEAWCVCLRKGGGSRRSTGEPKRRIALGAQFIPSELGADHRTDATCGRAGSRTPPCQRSAPRMGAREGGRGHAHYIFRACVRRLERASCARSSRVTPARRGLMTDIFALGCAAIRAARGRPLEQTRYAHLSRRPRVRGDARSFRGRYRTRTGRQLVRALP
jgi:hypothetical protein